MKNKIYGANTFGDLPLYIYSTPAHGFTLSMYIAYGPIFEKKGTEGISHFFEHMVFKRVNKEYDGRLFYILDGEALTFSGETYSDFIRFSISGEKSKLPRAIEIMDKVIHPGVTLTDLDIEKEKDRIKREIREDASKTSLYYLTRGRVFEGTTLSGNIAGSIKNVSKFSAIDVEKFQSETVNGSNSFLFLTGNTEKFKDSLIEPKFKAYKRSLDLKNSSIFKRDGVPFYKNAKSAEMSITFDVDSKKVTKYQRDLIFDILFTGDTSLFFDRLSEKTGLIYSFDTDLEEYDNVSTMSVMFECSPRDLDEVLKIAFSIFEEMKTEKHDESLALAKATYIMNSPLLLDDPDGLNFTVATERIMQGEDYDTLDARRERYNSVTSEDIQKASKSIFKDKNLTVVIKKPM